ncbi:hypothetical protein BGX26_008264, partial [Mortierella sp. AD094]
GIYEYTQRIKVLVKSSGVDPADKGVIRAIANSLPDQGKEKLIGEFTEDLKVPSINALIDYMGRNPTVLSGDRSDTVDWIIKVFNKTSTVTPEKQHASHTGSSGGSSNNTNRDYNNRGSSNRGATGNSSKNQKNRYQAYSKSTSKRVGFDTKDVCKHPVCVQFGRKHTASQCFSKTNPSKFEELNKSSSRNSGAKPAAKSERTFAIKHTSDFREDSLRETLGNTIVYNPNDIKENDDAYDAPIYDFVSTGRRLTLPILINGMELRALVDPGSTVSALNLALLESGDMSEDDSATVLFLDNAYAVSSITKKR